MRTKLLILLFFFFQTATAMVSDTAFIRTYGGINFEEFRDIVQTPDSGFMMAGFTNGYGSGSNAVYIVKTTKSGVHQWSRALGGSQTDLGYSISADATGNYYVAGTSSSSGNGGYDGYLICLDTNGNVLWEKYYGGSDWDFIYSVAVLPDQSLVIAGESYTFSDGGSDAWVLHLNSLGDTIWTRHFGDSGNDAFKNVIVSPTAIYLSGYIDSTDVNGLDGYVVKLDFSGNAVWGKRINSLGRDYLNGSVIDQTGDLILFGSTAQFDSIKNDALVAKLDTNGNEIWVHNSGSLEDDDAKKIIQVTNNELFLIGQKNPSGNGGKSIFMARYNSAGFDVGGGQSFGGSNDEEGYSMINTFEGGVAIVGSTTSYGIGNSDALLVFLHSDSSLTRPVVYSTNVFFENSLSPIGIEDILNNQNISIFPNPTCGSFNVQILNNMEVKSIQISDLSGKSLWPLLINHTSATNYFSIGNLPAGIYILKVEMRTGTDELFRIVKTQ